MQAPGQDLREKREGLGLTLRELARRVGVSPMCISDVELGHRAGSAKLWEGIARIIPGAGVRRLAMLRAMELLRRGEVDPERVIALARKDGEA